MRVGRTPQAVSNWIWHHDAFEPDVQWAGHGQDGPQPATRHGHFATHQEPVVGEHVLTRDRLGVNKLFYGIDAGGEVHSSNFLADLHRIGFPLSAIQSVPSGHSIYLSPDQRSLKLEPHSALEFEERETATSDGLIRHAETVRASLDATFARLASTLRGRRVFVTLSGGLDSTTIAVLAKRWLEDVTAVTFALDDGSARSDPSGDLASARRVAEHLGMPLEEVGVTPEELITLIDPVLTWGQDWRDFNVHCGLVNAAIAVRLRERLSEGTERGAPPPVARERPVILTGDTMNELMADYAPETYRGHEYYGLPRLSPTRLRRFLVDGLDSGDREVGIFAHYGFDTLQPYALCAEVYTAVPGSYLESPQVKQDLVRAVMGDEIPIHVYERPKVRAQVASAAGVAGTLATVVDRGFDSLRLAGRFAELFGATKEDLGSLVRAGFYRFAATYPSDRTEVDTTAVEGETK